MRTRALRLPLCGAAGGLRLPLGGRAAAKIARPASAAASSPHAAGTSHVRRMAASMTVALADRGGTTPRVAPPGVELTIAMPVYNERATAERAIESVLQGGFS